MKRQRALRTQTGSMAIFPTCTSAPGSAVLAPVDGACERMTTLPSIGMRPALTASSTSPILRCARVMLAELRMSTPGWLEANS